MKLENDFVTSYHIEFFGRNINRDSRKVLNFDLNFYAINYLSIFPALLGLSEHL